MSLFLTDQFKTLHKRLLRRIHTAGIKVSGTAQEAPTGKEGDLRKMSFNSKVFMTHRKKVFIF